MKNRFSQRLRAHRDRVEFNRAIANADPSMRKELLAAAAAQDLLR